MAIANKILSFWKQVKLKSSDMFTLFKVGIGIKFPTHQLHIKDKTDPLKIEGLQNDTTDPDKFLTIDSNYIIKYRTGTEVASDIGAVSSFILEDGDGTEVTITNGSEIKFVEGSGIDIDWTDVSDGSDTDPYDITFTIDHDAATNFVAAEHYRWDNDISGTATVHTNNITDLHGAGVDGSANQLLTDDGDGSVTSESTLTYTSNTLTIGDTDGHAVAINVPDHDDGDGGHLAIIAGSATNGQTDKNGGILSFYSGQGTGNADSSEIRFYTYPDGGISGTAIVVSPVRAATVTNNSRFRLDAGILSGPENGDLAIHSDGDIAFHLDLDNDETCKFSWVNGLSTEIASLDDSGDLQIDGDLTVSGGDITGPTDADLSINSDDDIILTVDSDGDGTPSILFRDRTAELARIDMAPGEATIHVGPDDDSLAVIRRKTHSDDDGGELNISGGDATGTNKHGGGLNLLGGRGTGNGVGGGIRFFQSAAGTSGSSANAITEIASLFGGNLTLSGGLQATSGVAGPTDGDLNIISDGNIIFKLDNDNDETGQSFSFKNYTTEIANLDESGDLQIDGDLAVDGGSIRNSLSASNFTISSSRVLLLQHGAAYDIELGNSTNANVLTVAGDSEEVTVNGTLKLPDNAIVGKQREVFFQNFYDDLGTTKHYLPFKSQSEQTSIYQEEAAVIMPCDGRIVSITLRVMFPNADGEITMGIHTRPVNVSAYTTASWVEEETEMLPLVNADDSHVFHFAFDNAKHFESSELVSISMQCSADISGSAYWYVSTVVEYDWSTFLGSTSAEIDSTP
jgi:hypothetical protein